MKKINFKKYINSIGRKVYRAIYNKFIRVGDPRGELSMFEAQAKLIFYINFIIFASIIFLVIISI